MARPAPKSLTWRAALFVVAICAAIIVLEGWREWVAYDAALQKAELETLNLARSMRQHAEDTYAIADQAVSLVSFEIETAGVEPEALDQTEAFMLRTIESARRLRGIYVYDADGNWLVTTAENMPPGGNQAAYSYFRNHMTSPSDAPSFGAPIRAAGDNAMVTTVSRRFDRPTAPGRHRAGDRIVPCPAQGWPRDLARDLAADRRRGLRQALGGRRHA